MIRVLVIIAVAGFLVSVATLSVAVGLAGPDAVLHGAWTWGPHGWGRTADDGGRDLDGDVVRTTRKIDWTDGDTLTVEIPADIEVTYGAGPAQISISGPLEAVADVEIEDGALRYRSDRDGETRLALAIAAPPVTRIVMKRHGAITLAPPVTTGR